MQWILQVVFFTLLVQVDYRTPLLLLIFPSLLYSLCEGITLILTRISKKEVGPRNKGGEGRLHARRKKRKRTSSP